MLNPILVIILHIPNYSIVKESLTVGKIGNMFHFGTSSLEDYFSLMMAKIDYFIEKAKIKRKKLGIFRNTSYLCSVKGETK